MGGEERGETELSTKKKKDRQTDPKKEVCFLHHCQHFQGEHYFISKMMLYNPLQHSASKKDTQVDEPSIFFQTPKFQKVMLVESLIFTSVGTKF